MTFRRWLLILFTLAVAIVLQTLPIPDWGIWLRPDWVLLVLIYWTMVVPYRISVGTAFIIGLLIDLINGSLLGEEALSLIIVTYLVAKFHKRLWLSPLLQKILVVLVLIALYKLIIFAIQGFLGQLPNTHWYWASAGVDVILWPWLFVLLNEWQMRFQIGTV